jgi:hypothetical protein
MKRLSPPKSLKLNRETLRRLNDEQLAQIGGGGLACTKCFSSCNTSVEGKSADTRCNTKSCQTEC